MARPHNLAGGRPALAPEDRREARIDVRLTPAERAACAAAAGAEGIGPWARRVLLRAAKRGR